MSRLSMITALLAVLVLSGCVASGVQVKPQQLSGLQKGVTTRQDVVSRLGQPTSSQVGMNGTVTLIYTYASVQMRPASFIPIVGAFAGGADTSSSWAWFQFDPAGHLVNYMASNSGIGTASGFAAPSTPTNADQPKKVD